jgi:transketolase
MVLENIEELRNVSRKIRQYVLAMAYQAGGAHIAPAFSVVDILVSLYWNYLNIDPGNVKAPDRDRFILSKGHGCVALYAILAERGFISKEELKKFCKIGGILGGHPDKLKVEGVEASTGSLGHGISIACGVALSGKKKGQNYKVLALLGDGECQEGSVWEAAMFAASQKLDNLIAIVDHNRLQGMGEVDEISSLSPIAEKWRSFGWSVKEIDGHDFSQLIECLGKIPFNQEKPSLIVANTVKGKGVTFMENKAIWHYRLPNDEELKIACKELQIDQIGEVLS